LVYDLRGMSVPGSLRTPALNRGQRMEQSTGYLVKVTCNCEPKYSYKIMIGVGLYSYRLRETLAIFCISSVDTSKQKYLYGKLSKMQFLG
jgi:hypothetical protein